MSIISIYYRVVRTIVNYNVYRIMTMRFVGQERNVRGRLFFAQQGYMILFARFISFSHVTLL